MASNAFARRLVRLLPGSARPYDGTEWEDELVVVVCGTVELEERTGRRWTFQKGSIIWLQQLPLLAINNPTADVTILMAISRPISSRPQPRQNSHERT